MPDGIPNYRSWYKAVSHLCEEYIGLALSDLPDLLTRDAFANGTTPEDFFADEVAELVMEEFGELGATLIANYRKKRPSILNPEVSYGKLD
jgi:hypothetical protein